VGIVLKLDFEKAFDKVNWDFLLNFLKAMGFSETLCEWIKNILYDGTVAVKINNVIGPYFKSSKDVRQGDRFPLSYSMLLCNALQKWLLRLKTIIFLLVWFLTLLKKLLLLCNMLMIPLFEFQN
jgi:hypothetical protein